MQSTPRPTPRPLPPAVGAREVFTAYARGNSRDELMDAMRTQASEYFDGPVSLRDAAVQPAPKGAPHRWQGSSRWTARP